MALQVNNFTVPRGCAWVQAFTHSPAQDVTGYTLLFTLRTRPAPGGSVVLTATPAVTDAASGTYQVSLTAAQLTLAPTLYYYDVARVNSGAEDVLSQGWFLVAGAARA